MYLALFMQEFIYISSCINNARYIPEANNDIFNPVEDDDVAYAPTKE